MTSRIRGEPGLANALPHLAEKLLVSRYSGPHGLDVLRNTMSRQHAALAGVAAWARQAERTRLASRRI
jgi:predicted transcriptional regulator